VLKLRNEMKLSKDVIFQALLAISVLGLASPSVLSDVTEQENAAPVEGVVSNQTLATAEQSASIKVDPVEVETQMQKDDPKAFVSDEEFIEAASTGNLDQVRDFIERGIFINSTTITGNTALLCAIKRGESGVAQLLIESGADFNLANSEGTTPLHAAAQRDDIGIVEELLARGASGDAKDGEGKTPLHIAAINNYTEVAECLVDTDSSGMRCKDNQELTPVDHAVINQSNDVLDLFVDESDSGLVYSKGCKMSALHFAVENGLVLAAHHLLAQRVINPSAYGHKYTATVRVDINEYNGDGYTPLHSAVMRADPAMVKLLISEGANVFLPKKLKSASFISDYHDDGCAPHPLLCTGNHEELEEHRYGIKMTPLHLLHKKFGSAEDFSAEVREIEFDLVVAEFYLSDIEHHSVPVEYLILRNVHNYWIKDLLTRILAHPEEYPDSTFDRSKCIMIARTLSLNDLVRKFTDLISKQL